MTKNPQPISTTGSNFFPPVDDATQIPEKQAIEFPEMGEPKEASVEGLATPEGKSVQVNQPVRNEEHGDLTENWKKVYDYTKTSSYNPRSDDRTFVNDQLDRAGYSMDQSGLELYWGKGATYESAGEQIKKTNERIFGENAIDRYFLLPEEEQLAEAKGAVEADTNKPVTGMAYGMYRTIGKVEQALVEATSGQISAQREKMLGESMSRSGGLIYRYAEDTLSPYDMSLAITMGRSPEAEEQLVEQYGDTIDGFNSEERAAFFGLMGVVNHEFALSFRQRLWPSAKDSFMHTKAGVEQYAAGAGRDLVSPTVTDQEFVNEIQAELGDIDPRQLYAPDGSVRPQFAKRTDAIIDQLEKRVDMSQSMFLGGTLGGSMTLEEKTRRLDEAKAERSTQLRENGKEIFEDILNNRHFDAQKELVKGIKAKRYTNLGTFQEDLIQAFGTVTDMTMIGMMGQFGIATTYARAVSEIENELIAVGTDRKTARNLSVIMAVPYALSEKVERVGMNPASKMWKGLYRGMAGKSHKMAWYMAQFGKRRGLQVLGEWSQEELQAGIVEASVKLAQEIAEVEGIDWKARGEAFREEAEDTGRVIAYTVLMGGAGHNVKTAVTSRSMSEGFVAPEFKDMWRDMGYGANETASVSENRQHMLNIAKSKDPDAAIRNVPDAVVRAYEDSETDEELDKKLAGLGYEGAALRQIKSAAAFKAKENVLVLERVLSRANDINAGIDAELAENQSEEAGAPTTPLRAIVEQAQAAIGNALGIETTFVESAEELKEKFPDADPKANGFISEDGKTVVMYEWKFSGKENAAKLMAEKWGHEAFGHKGLDLNPKRKAFISGVKNQLGMGHIRMMTSGYADQNLTDDELVEEYLADLVGKAFIQDALGTTPQSRGVWNRIKRWMSDTLGITGVAEMTAREVATLAKQVFEFGKAGEFAPTPDAKPDFEPAPESNRDRRRRQRRAGRQATAERDQEQEQRDIIVEDQRKRQEEQRRETEYWKRIEEEMLKHDQDLLDDPNMAENLGLLTEFLMDAYGISREDARQKVAKTSHRIRSIMVEALRTGRTMREVAIERGLLRTATEGALDFEADPLDADEMAVIEDSEQLTDEQMQALSENYDAFVAERERFEEEDRQREENSRKRDMDWKNIDTYFGHWVVHNGARYDRVQGEWIKRRTGNPVSSEAVNQKLNALADAKKAGMRYSRPSDRDEMGTNGVRMRFTDAEYIGELFNATKLETSPVAAGTIRYTRADVEKAKLESLSDFVPDVNESGGDRFEGVKKFLYTELGFLSDMIDPKSAWHTPTEGQSLIEYARNFFSEGGIAELRRSFESETAPEWVDDVEGWEAIKAELDIAKKIAAGDAKVRPSWGGEFLASNTKTGGKSWDFGLLTCMPTSGCDVCYAKAAASTRVAVSKARTRHTVVIALYPEVVGKAVANYVKSQKKSKLPFLRVNGSGDTTFKFQTDAVNAAIAKLDRPVHIFSRSHIRRTDGTVGLGDIDNGHYDPADIENGVVVYKMGSLDRQLVKEYGYKFLRENMEKRGILNSLLVGSLEDVKLAEDLRNRGIFILLHVDAKQSIVTALDKAGLLGTTKKLGLDTVVPVCPCALEGGALINGCATCMTSGGACFALGTQIAMTPDGQLYTYSTLMDKGMEDGADALVSMSQIGVPKTAKGKETVERGVISKAYRDAASGITSKIGKIRRDGGVGNITIVDPRTRETIANIRYENGGYKAAETFREDWRAFSKAILKMGEMEEELKKDRERVKGNMSMDRAVKKFVKYSRDPSISARTATKRSKQSTLVRELNSDLVSGHVLHQGAGRLDNPDRKALDKLGDSVVHYDINHSPETGHLLGAGNFDTVVSPFVANVIPPDARGMLYKTAADSLIKGGSYIINARGDVENAAKKAAKNGKPWTKEGDGYITSSGSFQRNYTREQLADELIPYFADIRELRQPDGKRFTEPTLIAREPRRGVRYSKKTRSDFQRNHPASPVTDLKGLNTIDVALHRVIAQGGRHAELAKLMRDNASMQLLSAPVNVRKGQGASARPFSVNTGSAETQGTILHEVTHAATLKAMRDSIDRYGRSKEGGQVSVRQSQKLKGKKYLEFVQATFIDSDLAQDDPMRAVATAYLAAVEHAKENLESAHAGHVNRVTVGISAFNVARILGEDMGKDIPVETGIRGKYSTLSARAMRDTDDVYITTGKNHKDVIKYLDEQGIDHRIEYAEVRISKADMATLIRGGTRVGGASYVTIVDKKIRVPKVESTVKGRAPFETAKHYFYGLGNLPEFVAEAMSNPSFMEYLDSVPSTSDKTKSIWGELLDALKSILGIGKKSKAATLFDEAIHATMGLMKESRAIKHDTAFEDWSRKSGDDVDTAREVLGVTPSNDMRYSRAPVKMTPAIKKWFGASKIVDADGDPKPFYHATTHDFSVFNQEGGNVESDMGAGVYLTSDPEDASENYAGEGADLTQRLEMRAEQIVGEMYDLGEQALELDEDEMMAEAMKEARKELSGGAFNVMPLLVRMVKPFEIGGENETMLELEIDEDGNESGDFQYVADAIRDVAGNFEAVSVEEVEQIIGELYEAALDYGGIGASELVKILRESNALAYAEDYDNGGLIGNEIMRQIIEELGFDGIMDHTVNRKFGSQREYGQGMAGMDEDTVHLITFKPNQLKSVFNEKPTRESNDIRYSRTASANAERAATLSVAQLLLNGKTVEIEAIKKMLKDAGGDPKKAEEIHQSAREIVADVHARQRDRGDRMTSTRDLKNAEAEHQRQKLLREAQKDGEEGGRIREQARQELQKRTAAKASADLVRRKGLDIDQLKESDLLVEDLISALAIAEDKRKKTKKTDKPEEEQSVATEADEGVDLGIETPQTSEGVTAYLGRVKEAVVESMKDRGELDANATLATAFADPVVRQEYVKTLQTLLTKTIGQITYSGERARLQKLIGKLDGIRKVELIDRSAEAILNRAYQKRVKESKAELLTRWNKAVKPAKKQGSTTTRWDKKKLGELVAGQLAMAKTASGMTEEEVADRMDELATEINSNARFDGTTSEKVEQEDYNATLISELNALERFGALKEKDVGDVVEAVNWAESEVKKEVEAQIEKVQATKARNRKRRDILIKAIEARKGKKPSKAGTGTMMYEDLLYDMIRSSKGKTRDDAVEVIKELMFEISKANQAMRIETTTEFGKLHSAIRDIYGVGKTGVDNQLRKLNKQDITGLSKGGQPMSIQQILQVVAWGEQEGYRKAAEVNGRDIEAYKAKLSEKDLKLLDWMRQYYNETRGSLSEVSERVTGMKVVSPDPLFMPMRLDNAEMIGSVNMPVFVPKSLSTRVSNTRDIEERVGVLDLFGDRLHSNAVFKNFSELGIEMRGVIAAGDLQKAVKSSLGDRIWKQFKDHSQDIMTQKPAGGDNDDFSKVLMNFGLVKLAYSVIPAVRQISSFPAFAYNHGMMNVTKYIAEGVTTEGWKAMGAIWKSPQAIARMGQGNSMIMAEAFASSTAGQNQFMTIMKTGLRLGLKPNQLMDRLTISLVGGGIYRAHLQTADRKGFTGAEAEKWAMDMTWQEVEQSQQSSFISQQTKWQRGSGVEKNAGMFTGTPQQFLSRELRDIRTAASSRSPEAYRNAINTVIINHLLMPSLFYSITALSKAIRGDEPDEEWWKEWGVYMFAGAYSGWFLGGSIATAVIKRFVTGKPSAYGNSFIPASGFITDAETAAGLVTDIIGQDYEKATEGFKKLMRSNAPLYRDLNKLYEQRIKD